jgi:hypothetical protein
MRRLVAIALVAGCAASSQAQRVAAIGATAPLVSLDSARAPLQSMPSHIALSLASASTATIDDGRHGSVWTWVALGTLVGGVVGGSMMKAHCSHHPASCVEFSIPLVAVLGGVGGGLVGALTFHLSQGRPGTSAPSSMTPDVR